MPVGTPGFKGSHLRAAREARGMTAVALAELVGAKPSSITHWENGDSSPRQEMTDEIARQLRIPVASLIRPDAPSEEGVIFFRSMSAATKTARLRAERRLGWF